MRKWIVAAAALLAVADGVADEGAPDARDVSLHAAFQMTDGNSDTRGFQLGYRGNRKADSSEWITLADFAYGESEGDKNVENAKASAQYNWLFGGRAYVHMKAEAGYDEIADVDYRVIIGPPGIGYHLLQDEETELALELSFAWLWEEVGGVSHDAPVIRLTERFQHKVSETAKVWQSLEVLPEADDFDSYLLVGEVGLEAMLNAHLSLILKLRNTYDSTPADGKEENDVAVYAGLGINL